MVKVKDLFQNRNQFDAKEIVEVSKFMFDAFFSKMRIGSNPLKFALPC